MKLSVRVLGAKVPTKSDEFHRFFANRWSELAKVVNGGLGFGNPTTGPDNVKCRWFYATINAANVDFIVTHNLGYVPEGFLVMWKDKYADFCRGAAAWGTNTISLQSNTAPVTVKLIVF